MVQNNKVLTVSYGTFSCTLEGFEDSFDTMKAIAEYFRDLAADDRYFGAEPPQPDADMLARIAQREISRQVEARADDEGIHLRAAQPVAVTAAPAATPPAEAQPVPAAPVQAETPEASPAEPVAEAPDATDLDDASAQAADQTASQAVTEAAQAVDQAAGPELEETEAAAEPVAVTTTAEAEAEEPASAPVAEFDDVIEAESPAAVMEPVAEPAAAPPVDTQPDEAPEPSADSIAAKLQRIREVVSRKANPLDEAEFTEDEHAQGFVAEAAREIDEHLNSQDDEILAAVQSETGSDVDPMMTIEEAFAEPVAEIEAPESPDEQAGADEPEMPGEIATAGTADETPDEPAPVSEEDAPESELAEEAEALPASGIRVHKVKREQIDELLAGDDIEEIEEFEDIDPAVVAETPVESSLSVEDEAELLRELAEVEADLPDADIVENVFAETSDPAPADPVAPVREDRGHATSESDVSRLLDAADEKLDDPEVSSARETFNQMRAAVAATEAERKAGHTTDGQADDDPYRADLASVVRPRRPAPAVAKAERPVRSPNVAPLKLVAEQRVDSPDDRKGPIRPRRIPDAQPQEPVSTPGQAREGGFAAFAEEQGAVELSELLEAAAAYLSFVEGREQFSRPQLMNKVRQARQRHRFQPRRRSALLWPAAARRQDRKGRERPVHCFRRHRLSPRLPRRWLTPLRQNRKAYLKNHKGQRQH